MIYHMAYPHGQVLSSCQTTRLLFSGTPACMLASTRPLATLRGMPKMEIPDRKPTETAPKASKKARKRLKLHLQKLHTWPSTLQAICPSSKILKSTASSLRLASAPVSLAAARAVNLRMPCGAPLMPSGCSRELSCSATSNAPGARVSAEGAEGNRHTASVSDCRKLWPWKSGP